MNCPNCNSPTTAGQRFCATCGYALQPSAPRPQQPEPVQTEAPAIAARRRRPSRGAAAPLAVLGALVLLGTLLTFGILAWARAGEGAETVDPAALLASARQGVNRVEGVRYREEAGFFGFDTGSEVTRTTTLTVAVQGEIVRPRNFTIDSNAPQLGEYIVIEDRAWHRRTPRSEWIEQESSDLTLGLLNPLTLFNYLEYAKPDSLVLVGSEQRAGRNLQRLRFEIDAGRMSAESSEEALRRILSSSRLDADIWVDPSTGFLHSITVSVESDDGTGILLRTDFTDHNSGIAISPPSE
jgi:hypothetical protein